MQQTLPSELDKSSSSVVREGKSVVSNRGDVELMVRSMRSDWIQKARLLPQGDVGLADSGAQISVTNVATATNKAVWFAATKQSTTLRFVLGLRKVQKSWLESMTL